MIRFPLACATAVAAGGTRMVVSDCTITAGPAIRSPVRSEDRSISPTSSRPPSNTTVRRPRSAVVSMSILVSEIGLRRPLTTVRRVASRIGLAGVRPPVLLDETFDQLDPAVVPLLLELLPGLVGDLQVILLTDDEAIASWARLEALAGELALVEPALAAD